MISLDIAIALAEILLGLNAFEKLSIESGSTARIKVNPMMHRFRETLDVIEQAKLIQNSERLREETDDRTTPFHRVCSTFQDNKIIDTGPEQAMAHDQTAQPRAHNYNTHV